MADTASRQTRSATGNSKPRIFPKIEEVPLVKKARKSSKKSAPLKTKANTSKPRVDKTATGRVSKPSTSSSAATKKATTTKKSTAAKAVEKVEEKVNGATEKVDGALEKKPGKKAAGTKKLKGETTKKPAPKTKAVVKA